MDQGRFDLAQVLCLAEEPPASVFTHRPVSMLSRSRAFSPLADQRWITVALAYLTELDTSTAKRAEMGNVSRPGTFGGQNSDEAPKPKPEPKKKGKWRGKGASQSKQDQEEA